MTDEYPHPVPRWLHKPYGDTLKVETIAECEAARAEGWLLSPPVWPPDTRPVIIVPESEPTAKRKGKK